MDRKDSREIANHCYVKRRCSPRRLRRNSINSTNRSSIPSSLDSISSWRRSAIKSTTLKTSSQCLIKLIKWSPLGPQYPENQFFTVRSLAPVQEDTIFTCAGVLPSAPLSAAAISAANTLDLIL